MVVVQAGKQAATGGVQQLVTRFECKAWCNLVDALALQADIDRFRMALQRGIFY
jgi:hypothetical protein